MHTFRTARARALAVLAVGLLATVGVPSSPASAGTTTPAAATISRFSPTSGFDSGGTAVTITGARFTGATAVAFGTVAATRFAITSDTTIVALSPALAEGSYSVSVTTAGGTVSRGTFTVRTVAAEVLRLVNQARRTSRKCGGTTYKAVPALRANATLARVAAAHSADMAGNDYFSHQSLNGDSPFDRMQDAGYRYSSAGENIAAGYRSPASVVKAWLASAGHCRNIMRRAFTQLGVGYAAGGTYGNYWTQDFGAPR